ncbi:hypothetical protein M3610_02785 [Neobacillus sp. MER 74]|uniref:hypothetical protein n=1 Tax=Neobacillus sp. MER 74 TaxID=2939566 RepID=UPI00203B7394|nr:hypothetical protein [Neobacillus sp. MER 74]MCM3114218.1 hypothetical protein [Neobacillus sp. MER 74]
MTNKTEKVLESENQKVEVEEEQNASSLDLLWKLGFNELDAWENRLNKRDTLFLEAVKNYVEMLKQNQENALTVSTQFGVELKEWEEPVREELLMTTTPLQQFFPVKSYEEINKVVEDIQTKTAHLLLTPTKALLTGQLNSLDKYVETVEQYIAYRKNGREKYIESVKKTSNVLYENQKVFVNMFSKQVKSAIMPFQNYMKDSTNQSK